MPATATAVKTKLSRQQYLDLYYFMRLNREVEDTMTRLFRQKQNRRRPLLQPRPGGHLRRQRLRAREKRLDGPDDPQHRRAARQRRSPRDIFTQHMAKYTSPTKGKDGTSHFGDLENLHIVSPISMLGDLIPVLTGVAMAGRYLGQKIVAMTWIGDGGSSTGVFHEGLNLAASQKAAFVLILENNQWAYSTPVRRQVPLEISPIAPRPMAFPATSSTATIQSPSTRPPRKPSIAPVPAKAPSSSKPKLSAAAATPSTTPPSTFRPSSASIGKSAIPSPSTKNSSPPKKFSTPRQKKSRK